MILPLVVPSAGVVLVGIVHVALSEHMGYFGIALDRHSTLHLQDYLQSDSPIRSWTISFSPVFVVLGVLVPIVGSTVSSVPSVMSRKSSLNLSHCTTTKPASWVALISP